MSFSLFYKYFLQPDYDDFDDESRLRTNMRGRVDKARDNSKKYGNNLFNIFFIFWKVSFCNSISVVEFTIASFMQSEQLVWKKIYVIRSTLDPFFNVLIELSHIRSAGVPEILLHFFPKDNFP
jgi:hypothetical protein